ncbi:acyltransferase family protein [Zhongshania aquimaris]|uniref:Acyltransferase n=1 Tax=Zhongshania aquimaris TaxID=2857107 RepID=A0ABS6VPE0_9GAMM|nr:acyltransferase [Zhongshania aquimaris]
MSTLDRVNLQNAVTRVDIQILRAIAVLVVVFYHTQLGIFDAGYLGVDIFFVISGYLITLQIVRSLDSGNFSFIGFYSRRARRLLPAFFSTLLVTISLAPIFLTNEQWGDFVNQVWAAVLFSENLVLPFQSGYFENAAHTKPLMHIWSLSLEEQFYFILPAILFFFSAKRTFVLAMLFLISLGMCFLVVSDQINALPIKNSIDNQAWAFYLLPYRAWEMLFGSLCAVYFQSQGGGRFPFFVKGVLSFFLICLCFKSISLQSPGFDSVLVVFITGMVLLDKRQIFPNNFIIRSLCKIGDWSYSIYLIHWPLFVFSSLFFLGRIPIYFSFSLVVVSILLGGLQYKYIESKFKNIIFGRKRVAIGLISLAALSCGVIPVAIEKQYEKYSLSSDAAGTPGRNYGLSRKCRFGSFVDGVLEGECRTAENPTVAVWGDSYAMHIVAGVLQAEKYLVQLTMSSCAPALEYSHVNKDFPLARARLCNSNNQKALDYILNKSSINLVIISSQFSYYGDDGNMFLSEGQLKRFDRSDFIARWVDVISKIEEAGKKVVIVSPTPQTEDAVDIHGCYMRALEGLVTFLDGCTIPMSASSVRQTLSHQLVGAIAERASVDVVWLYKKLCSAERCETKIGDIFLYRDYGHLTPEGSIMLLKDVVWPN